MLDNKEFNNEVLLQKIAKKINISEVTFINIDEGNFFIRWFSPSIEVDICGHGTIAGFEILVFTGICEPDQWRTIKSDKYTFKLKKISKNDKILLKIPFFNLLKTEKNTFIDIMDINLIKNFSSSNLDYIVETYSLSNLINVKINFDKLIKTEKRGLILCYIDSSNNKIHYRYFCPKLGFKEDFGTGSAHSSLYPFLKDRLDFSKKIHFYQESQRKSMGLISKLKEDNHIVIETDVSEYSVKALEID